MTIVTVFFVAAALVGAGALSAAWKRDLAAALAGVPLMFAGAGVAFVGVARFATHVDEPLLAQELAVLLAITALAVVMLGLALSGREGSR